MIEKKAGYEMPSDYQMHMIKLYSLARVIALALAAQSTEQSTQSQRLVETGVASTVNVVVAVVSPSRHLFCW